MGEGTQQEGWRQVPNQFERGGWLQYIPTDPSHRNLEIYRILEGGIDMSPVEKNHNGLRHIMNGFINSYYTLLKLARLEIELLLESAQYTSPLHKNTNALLSLQV